MSRTQLLWAIAKQCENSPHLALIAVELPRLSARELEWLYRQGTTAVCWKHRCLKRDRRHCRACGREYTRRWRARELDARFERIWRQRYSTEERAYYKAAP